jgi:hypothetical protein
MTRKEALAMLDRGTLAMISTSLHIDPKRDNERWQVFSDMCEAVRVLTPLVHGKAPHNCFSTLCQACSLRYASWKTGETYHDDFLCQPCREAKAKQQEQTSETSEVTG